MMKHTILIVEDEDPVRRLVTRILTKAGIDKLLIAKSGEEGIRIAAEYEHPIHLLLVNAILPGMLGTTLAVKLKRTRPGLRVILLTGSAHSDLAMLSGGGWKLIQKSLLGADLLERVRSELTIRQGAGGA